MCLVVSARYHGRPVGRPYHYGKVNHTTVRKDPLCLGASARYHGRPLGRPYHYDKVCHTTVRKDPPCLGVSARILQGALSDALTSTTKSAIQLFEKILRASAPPHAFFRAPSRTPLPLRQSQPYNCSKRSSVPRRLRALSRAPSRTPLPLRQSQPYNCSKRLRASASLRVITGTLSDALTTTTKSAIQLFEKILCASAPPRAHRDHPVQPHATPLRSLRAIFRIHSIFVFRKRTADATEMV